MNVDKLFQVLVVGGALIAGTACSGGDEPIDAQPPAPIDAPSADAESPPVDAMPDAAAEVNYCGCAGQPGDCACGTSPCCWLVYSPCCDECPE